jgi:hypothetical protein
LQIVQQLFCLGMAHTNPGNRVRRRSRLLFIGLREVEYHSSLVGYNFDAVAIQYPAVQSQQHNRHRLPQRGNVELTLITSTVAERMVAAIVASHLPDSDRFFVGHIKVTDQQHQDVFAGTLSATLEAVKLLDGDFYRAGGLTQ